MHAIILAATHEHVVNVDGREVPQPLLDLDNEPLLTILVKRLSVLPDLRKICVITNNAIKPALDDWRGALDDQPVPVEVRSDGTSRPEERIGAIGDLIFAIREWHIQDELLVVGGDNWFTYDIAEFVKTSRDHSPAVVVTRFGPGWRSQRFGVVQVDDSKRIVQFLEKPDTTTLDLKASCVYFFGADDLRWLDEFAKEHSTGCSPGTFLQWLVRQTLVYAVEMQAAWYDVGRAPTSILKGPDFIALRDILRKSTSRTHSDWEGAAARQLQWVSSYLDLLDVLADADPNRRIVAAGILGRSGALFSPQATDQVIRALCGLLGDRAMNRIPTDGYQMDEESMSFVSVAAAEALAKLGYARTPSDVFHRGREEGLTVFEAQNTL